MLFVFVLFVGIEISSLNGFAVLCSLLRFVELMLLHGSFDSVMTLEIRGLELESADPSIRLPLNVTVKKKNCTVHCSIMLYISCSVYIIPSPGLSEP